MQQINSIARPSNERLKGTTTQPLVSVCIPTFNNAPMLIDAVRSSMRQTYRTLEIWIVDNCSADDTEQMARRLVSEDSRVHYLRHTKNIGMQRNFNACLEVARGEFVLVLCSDDILEENSIATLLGALMENPSAVFAASGRTFVNAQLEPIKICKPHARRRVCNGLAVARECVARGNFIGEPSAVMIRRQAASRGFDVYYSQLLDLEMWLHLASIGPAVLLPETLCKIRQHGNQLSVSNFRTGRLLEEKKKLFQNELLVIRKSLSLWSKVCWDIRMVASISRVRVFGGRATPSHGDGVFYKPLFLAVMWIVRAGWPLTRAWIKRTHRAQ
jgi:hypothetical protein